jgi:hypothetical protein
MALKASEASCIMQLVAFYVDFTQGEPMSEKIGNSHLAINLDGQGRDFVVNVDPAAVCSERAQLLSEIVGHVYLSINAI